jgi:hypothetical protein
MPLDPALAFVSSHFGQGDAAPARLVGHCARHSAALRLGSIAHNAHATAHAPKHLHRRACLGARQARLQRKIALAESFCDQAVIAIERLFNETEGVGAADSRRRSAAGYLRSTFDLAPVFEALVQNAARLWAKLARSSARRDRCAAATGQPAMVEFFHTPAQHCTGPPDDHAAWKGTRQVLDAMVT